MSNKDFNARNLVDYLLGLEKAGEVLSNMKLGIVYKRQENGDMSSMLPVTGVESNNVALGFEFGLGDALVDLGVVDILGAVNFVNTK